MHFLLNRYRPHQARDTLRLLMERQIKRRKKTTESVKSCCDEVMAMLNKIFEDSERPLSLQEPEEMDITLSVQAPIAENEKEMVIDEEKLEETEKSDIYWEQHRKMLELADRAIGDPDFRLY
ncbi:hypothetical protein BC829DRAFT_196847 [Chytridium lagenaria]|nr:hypothetical protein BC829DRAFT_196847 [Chytridium lagenaria]